MTVGLLLVDCYIGGSQSLKDKRRVMKSLTERLRRGFNIAVCEYDSQDKWQRSRLAIVTVNTQWRMAQSAMTKMLEFLERDRRVTILDSQIQQLC
jgi:uncharacterized protein YlxP (DUF503 family)